MKKVLDYVKSNYLFFLFLLFYLLLIVGLSFFRDMVNDETLYFQETYLISQLFSSGKWIGNYGVGIHGFLFKIPPAIIFLITNPSVEIVTVYHIILTAIVGILGYRLFLKIFKNRTYALLGVIFLMTNFHFVLSSYTYLREIPGLLTVLLLLNYIIKEKKNNLVLGLLFLLLLDAKEYIFLIFALTYIIWLFIDSKETNLFKRVFHVSKTSFMIFFPSIVWILLMFFTPIIPVNMFLASSLGLLSSGFSYFLLNFNIDLSTMNLFEGGREIPLVAIDPSSSKLVQFEVGTLNTFLSYIGKTLYPRTFSFLSVPKVVLLPVVFSSIVVLKGYIKGRKENFKKYAFFSLLILIWILVFILRASHGRYLLPLVPAISIMYIYLLFIHKFTTKQRDTMLLLTLVYFLSGYFFETTYVFYKLIIESTIFGVFLFSMFKPNVKKLKYLLLLLISFATFSTSILFSYVQGQIYGYMEYGKNRNASEFAQFLPKERYWTNNVVNQSVIAVFQQDPYLPPEWKWKLAEYLPRRQNLKTYQPQNIFNFAIEDITGFKQNLLEYDIQKVVLITTQKDKDAYQYQEYLSIFLQQDWLELESELDSKNMVIYIFDVKL